MVLGEGRINAFGPREPTHTRERILIGAISERAFMLRRYKYILSEERHLSRGMLCIERNESRKVLGAGTTTRRQIAGDAVLEFVLLHYFRILVELPLRRNADRIDHHCALCAHGPDRAIKEFIDTVIKACVLAQHTDAYALEAIGLQREPVVGRRLILEASRGRIIRIVTGDRRQHGRGIGYRARQWSGCV